MENNSTLRFKLFKIIAFVVMFPVAFYMFYKMDKLSWWEILICDVVFISFFSFMLYIMIQLFYQI